MKIKFFNRINQARLPLLVVKVYLLFKNEIDMSPDVYHYYACGDKLMNVSRPSQIYLYGAGWPYGKTF